MTPDHATTVQAARELVELAEKATSGPWEARPMMYLQGDSWVEGDESDWFITDGESNLGGEINKANAAFIAAARNSLPAIAAALIEASEREAILEDENSTLEARNGELVEWLGADRVNMADRIAELEALLAERDSFIVRNGLWTKFVAALAQPEEPT